VNLIDLQNFGDRCTETPSAPGAEGNGTPVGPPITALEVLVVPSQCSLHGRGAERVDGGGRLSSEFRTESVLQDDLDANLCRFDSVRSLELLYAR
jgi:hypothetical protein